MSDASGAARWEVCDCTVAHIRPEVHKGLHGLWALRMPHGRGLQQSGCGHVNPSAGSAIASGQASTASTAPPAKSLKPQHCTPNPEPPKPQRAQDDPDEATPLHEQRRSVGSVELLLRSPVFGSVFQSRFPSSTLLPFFFLGSLIKTE